MSWDELDISDKDPEKAKKEHHEKVVALAKSYAHVFADEIGQKVLQDLVNVFIMDNDTELNAPNVNYSAAYKNGEAGAVKYILNQIKRAQYE
jgi:BRCT domain type II-containing protein